MMLASMCSRSLLCANGETKDGDRDRDRQDDQFSAVCVLLAVVEEWPLVKVDKQFMVDRGTSELRQMSPQSGLNAKHQLRLKV
jgi:hypothetical protein